MLCLTPDTGSRLQRCLNARKSRTKPPLKDLFRAFDLAERGSKMDSSACRAARRLTGTQSTKEIGTMQEINKSGGLCATCNNAPGCFHRARRGPALFCELFDSFVPPLLQSSRVADTQSSGRSNPSPPAALEPPKYSGLCMNCIHRTICAPSRTSGGIWHCENYE
jgi:hypothetical protein